MIVKMQLSLRTTAEKRQVLIYNEARTVEWQGDASEEILKAMGDRDKAFFSARMRGTVIEINEPVYERDW